MIQVGFDKLREEVLQIVCVYKRRANVKPNVFNQDSLYT